MSDTVFVHKDVTITNNIHITGTIIGYYADDAENQPVSEKTPSLHDVFSESF